MYLEVVYFRLSENPVQVEWSDNLLMPPQIYQGSFENFLSFHQNAVCIPIEHKLADILRWQL